MKKYPMAWSFSFSFYKRDKDVREDEELQAYVNELSIEGTGPNGGSGQVMKRHGVDHNRKLLVCIHYESLVLIIQPLNLLPINVDKILEPVYYKVIGSKSKC